MTLHVPLAASPQPDDARTVREPRVKRAGLSAADALSAARLGMAVCLGLRLALSPFAAAVGQPDPLWRPRGTGLVLASPPPVALVVSLQVLGTAAAALFVWRRRLPPLVVAWACLLLLAGLRTSLGKILHNDVLLILASAPLLLAGSLPPEEMEGQVRPAGSSEELEGSIPTGLATQRSPRVAAGLPAPQRGKAGPVPPAEEAARTGIDCAAAIVLVSYLCTAWWKLLRAGPAWALSDNLRWSLAAGRGGSHWPALSRWLVDHPAVCVALACMILGLELCAPVLWLRPRLALPFVAAAALLHGGTWIVLGLDYWAHLATVALVLVPWARMQRR